jgi:ribA/ribD-fused uncharacterized protein
LPDFEDAVNLVDSQDDSKYPKSIISASFNEQAFIENRSSKTGVASESLVSTFNAITQGTDLALTKLVPDEGGFLKPVEFGFKVKVLDASGKIKTIVLNKFSSSTGLKGLGNTTHRTYAKKEDGSYQVVKTYERTKSLNINNLQSIAVDNAKNGNMGKGNMNDFTMAALNTLTRLESADDSNNVLPMNSLIWMIKQQGVLDYVREVQTLNDTTVEDFNPNKKQEIIIKLLDKYMDIAEIKKEGRDYTYDENYELPVELSNDASNPGLFELLNDKTVDRRLWAYQQMNILKLFVTLDELGALDKDTMTALNSDSKGVGKSLIASNLKEKNFNDVVSGNKKSIPNVDGNPIFRIEGMDTVASKNRQIGQATENSVVLANGIFSNLYPYNSVMMNRILDLYSMFSGKKKATGVNEKEQRNLMNAFKSFIFTSKLVNLFDNVTSERARLMTTSYKNVYPKKQIAESDKVGNTGKILLSFNENLEDGIYRIGNKHVRVTKAGTLKTSFNGSSNSDWTTLDGKVIPFNTESQLLKLAVAEGFKSFAEWKNDTVSKGNFKFFNKGEVKHYYKYEIVNVEEDNQSLAKRLDVFKKKYPDNYLLKRLVGESATDLGNSFDLVKYSAAVSQNLDDIDNTKAFAELLVSDDDATREFANDLIKYAFITGGNNTPISFLKYIPAQVLMHNDFSQGLRDAQNLMDEGNIQEINYIVFLRQYFQHNPLKAIKLDEQELFNPTNKKKVVEIPETFTIAKNNPTAYEKKLLAIQNKLFNEGSKIDSEYLKQEGEITGLHSETVVPKFAYIYGQNREVFLYEATETQTGFEYKRINTLGTKKLGSTEYNGSNDSSTSLLDVNNNSLLTEEKNLDKGTVFIEYIKSPKNVLKITPIQAADKKAISKAKIANKFIGFAENILNSSTGEYAKQAGGNANLQNYDANDVVFVSIGGKRGNEENRRAQQNKTIALAMKALFDGATILTDNQEYVINSDYNEGEKKLKEELEKHAFYTEVVIDGNTIGVWSLRKFADSNQIPEVDITPQQQGIETKSIETKPVESKNVSSVDKINIYSTDSNGFKNLSNLLTNPVTIDINGKQVTFKTIEHAYQTKKALFANDRDAAGKIFNSVNGWDAQKLGRTIKGLNSKEWDKISESVLEDIMKSYYQQDLSARQLLLSTGNAELTHLSNRNLGKWSEVFPRLLMNIRNSSSVDKNKDSIIGMKGKTDYRDAENNVTGEILEYKEDVTNKGTPQWKVKIKQSDGKTYNFHYSPLGIGFSWKFEPRFYELFKQYETKFFKENYVEGFSDKNTETNKNIIVEKPFAGVETIKDSGLSIEQANEFIDILSPVIQRSAERENQSPNSNYMFSFGKRWGRIKAVRGRNKELFDKLFKGGNTDFNKEFEEVEKLTDVNKLKGWQILLNKWIGTKFDTTINPYNKGWSASGYNYAYDSNDAFGNPVESMDTIKPITDYIQSKLKIDLSGFNSVLANIYTPTQFIPPHRDTTEDDKSGGYAIVVINIGADGSITEVTSQKSVTLQNGGIYAFGVNGVDRFNFYHTIKPNEFGNNTPTKPITLPDDTILKNYRITMTYRMVNDPATLGLPNKPKRIVEKNNSTEAQKLLTTDLSNDKLTKMLSDIANKGGLNGELAKVLLDHPNVKKAKVGLFTQEEKNAMTKGVPPAAAFPNSGDIKFDSEQFDNLDDFERTLLHEALHIATSNEWNAYNLDKAGYKAKFPQKADVLEKIDTFRERIKSWLEKGGSITLADGTIINKAGLDEFNKKQIKRGEKDYDSSDVGFYYGLTNTKEFISVLMTEPMMQEALSKIPYGQGRTIWDRIQDLFESFVKHLSKQFGKDVNKTVLSESVGNVLDLLTLREKIVEKEDLEQYKNLVGKKYKGELIVKDNIEAGYIEYGIRHAEGYNRAKRTDVIKYLKDLESGLIEEIIPEHVMVRTILNSLPIAHLTTQHGNYNVHSFEEGDEFLKTTISTSKVFTISDKPYILERRKLTASTKYDRKKGGHDDSVTEYLVIPSLKMIVLKDDFSKVVNNRTISNWEVTTNDSMYSEAKIKTELLKNKKSDANNKSLNKSIDVPVVTTRAPSPVYSSNTSKILNTIEVNGQQVKTSVFKDGKEIGITLNKDQEQGLREFANYFDAWKNGKTGDNHFKLLAKGGRGKTAIAKTMTEYIKKATKNGINKAVVTPTHKAGKVATRALTGKSTGYLTVASLTNKIRNGQPIPKLLVFDEVSMIGSRDFDMIMKYAKANDIFILSMGDIHQLPPIGDNNKISKFFDSKDGKTYYLNEPMRFGKESGIFAISESVANNLKVLNGGISEYGNSEQGDVEIVTSSNDLLEQFMKYFYPVIDDVKEKSLVKIIAYGNNTVAMYNNLIRRRIFGVEAVAKQVLKGDILMGQLNWGQNPLRVPVQNSQDYIVINEPKEKQHSISYSYKEQRLNFNITYLSLLIQEPDAKVGIPPKTVQWVDISNPENKDFGNFIFDLNQALANMKPENRFHSEERALLEQIEADGWLVPNILIRSNKNKQIYSTNEVYELVKKTFGLKSQKDITDKYEQLLRDGQLTSLDGNIQHGYSLSSHKSQGSTYKIVLVDDKNISYREKDRLVNNLDGTFEGYEANHMRYVAFSRPTDKLIIYTDKQVGDTLKLTSDKSDNAIVQSKPAIQLESDNSLSVNNLSDFVKDLSPKERILFTKLKLSKTIETNCK